MEYSSRIFVPNISAEYFRRNAIKKRGKSGQLEIPRVPFMSAVAFAYCSSQEVDLQYVNS